MNFFNLFKSKKQSALFSGGNGDSLDRAVIIDTDNADIGVQAEYEYMANAFGKPFRDWMPLGQSLQKHDDKPYDVHMIITKDGQHKTIFFDISRFFGRE